MKALQWRDLKQWSIEWKGMRHDSILYWNIWCEIIYHEETLIHCEYRHTGLHHVRHEKSLINCKKILFDILQYHANKIFIHWGLPWNLYLYLKSRSNAKYWYNANVQFFAYPLILVLWFPRFELEISMLPE